tara:strand:- start:1640 stop:2947 length:1308 start_codon:yes stop_codon:yes gene_type:complete
MKLKISEIIWGDRARKDYGDSDSLLGLSQSISKNGLLHPIVIDDTLTLRAGGRRLTAVTMLGWEEVEVTTLANLSPLQKLEVELEENLHRKSFEYSEQVSLVKRIHEIKTEVAKESGEDWSLENTAEALGISTQSAQQDIALAKEIENDPEIGKAQNKGQAKTRARRAKEVRRITAEVAAAPVSTNEEIHLGDARLVLIDIPDDSVDLILCDPPFGVKFNDNSRNKGYETTYGEFHDDLNEVCKLLESVIPKLFRILKPGGHMYMFFALSNYTRIDMTMQRAWKGKTETGKYSPNPLLWVKPSNENPRPYERFTVNYEPFFFAWKGKVNSKLGNEINAPSNSTFNFNYKGSDKLHPAEKPEELYEKLISLSSVPGATVLDPFLGSGVSLAVARRMGRKIIGIEQVESWHKVAMHKIYHSEPNPEEKETTNEEINS